MEDQREIEARKQQALLNFEHFKRSLDMLWSDYESSGMREAAYQAGKIYCEISRDLQARFDLPRYDEVDVQAEVDAAFGAGFLAKRRKYVYGPDFNSIEEQYGDRQISGKDYKAARLEMWNNWNLAT